MADLRIIRIDERYALSQTRNQFSDALWHRDGRCLCLIAEILRGVRGIEPFHATPLFERNSN